MHGANKQAYLNFRDLLPQMDFQELLRRLNKECVLPKEELERFQLLNKKRKTSELHKEELIELFALIKKEEVMRLKRVKVLGELSIIKGIPLLQLIKNLGMEPSSNA